MNIKLCLYGTAAVATIAGLVYMYFSVLIFSSNQIGEWFDKNVCVIIISVWLREFYSNVNNDVSRGIFHRNLIASLIDFYVSTLSLPYYFDVHEFTGLHILN